MIERLNPEARKRFLPWWLESASIGIFYFMALKLVPASWVQDTPTLVAVLVVASVTWFVAIAALNRLAVRS